jgi:hypothetical protein
MRPIDLSYLVAPQRARWRTPRRHDHAVEQPLRIAGMPKHQTGNCAISASPEVRRRERLRPFTNL